MQIFRGLFNLICVACWFYYFYFKWRKTGMECQINAVQGNQKFTQLFVVNTMILLSSNPTTYTLSHWINIAFLFLNMLFW